MNLKRRIGLVLGAGGPVGHAFHSGVLAAVEESLGWDPREAHVVMGTSAGAQVAALLRAGMASKDLHARVSGEPMTEKGQVIAQHYVRPPFVPHADYPRRFLPLAPSYFLRHLGRPWRVRPGRMVAAMLPPGRVCLRLQAEGLQRLFGDRWPVDPLWITAVSVRHGELVAFGRDGAPAVDVGTAVTCSGAVPWVCAPVRVGDDHYVDGGVASATNLHLIEAANVDAVIVSSPLSRHPLMRWLFRREVARLARRGIEVYSFEPDRSVEKAMGFNPMKLERSARVAHAARASTLEALSHRRVSKIRGSD